MKIALEISIISKGRVRFRPSSFLASEFERLLHVVSDSLMSNFPFKATETPFKQRRDDGGCHILHSFSTTLTFDRFQL